MVTREQNNYLCALRDSGVTNMFGAAPYLMGKFRLEKREAERVLMEWMRGPRHEYIKEEATADES